MRSSAPSAHGVQQQPHHHHVHHGNNKSPSCLESHCCSCNNCNSAVEKDYYNMCECTSCRNLGNSVDICCQCCSCSSAEHYQRYTVASMAMQEDTLEVCLHSGTADQASHQPDDIALAHNLAEQRHHNCHDCHPPTQQQPCCHPRQSQRPLFHGWQQHMQQKRTKHFCAKGNHALADISFECSLKFKTILVERFCMRICMSS